MKKEEIKIYNSKRYKERRDKYINQLGGKCVNCETSDNLEFDHINPSDKSFDIGEYLKGDEDKLKTEILKCQLLCKTCHKKKTSIDKFNKYCKHGHEMTDENTYLRYRSNGQRDRRCRLCQNITLQKWRTARKVKTDKIN